MSRGLSKMQMTILGLLQGTERGLVFSGGREWTTGELLAELTERGRIGESVRRKIALYTVRRACNSLQVRGLIDGEYTIDCDHPGANTISWSIKEESTPSKTPLL
jgi:hypothetical protein